MEKNNPDEELGLGELINRGLIQAKLNVSHPGDIFEKQADKIANEVVNMTDVEIQSKDQQKMDTIQAKSTEISTVPSSIEYKIKKLKGKGSPFDRNILDYLQPRFGVDLENVRIHTDSNANKLAQSINAKAFTLGNDIAFAKGQYQPGTKEGKKLIAHELTHSMQQDLTKTVMRWIDNGDGTKTAEQGDSLDGGFGVGWASITNWDPDRCPTNLQGGERVADCSIIQNNLNTSLLAAGGSSAPLSDYINQDLLAQAILNPDGLNLLDPVTKSFVDSLTQSELSNMLTQINVISDANLGIYNSVYQQFIPKSYTNIPDQASIGNTIYVFSTLTPGSISQGESTILGHEIIHCLQFFARGGFSVMIKAYNTNMNLLETTAYEFGGNNTIYTPNTTRNIGGFAPYLETVGDFRR